ncbi:sialate O-acetylesterase [Ruminiclostridium cellulolyticum]|uniref:sialate O-acetylesterase n=1 Tax=Ruminiclostridium cellulolyticum TaxID=1521 RepID=UPI0000E94108|nr:sialate O-acetylesterase [Ruminiclostridium cellulolyticum]
MNSNRPKIRLPRIISDGMVLQRNTDVKIWGWASPGEAVTVRFIGKAYHAFADDSGEWFVRLEQAKAGGPYDMYIETEESLEKITIKNILMGDVWLCSGQSNMEMKMDSVKDTYPDEIVHSCNDYIRHFLVPVKYDFEKPQTDLEAGIWEAANPESILDFTATGYFFALKLFEKYNIPIGLINASLGGSPAEAWLSENALREFPEHYESAKQLSNRDYLDKVLREDQESAEAWYTALNQNDEGLKSNDIPFHDTEYDAPFWQNIKVPSYWEDEGVGNFNGVVWFRKEIDIPSTLADKPARLVLGNIVDEDTAYINGIEVGTTPNQYITRKYSIQEGLLKEGKNTIVLRVVNTAGKGGFYKDKPYQLEIGDNIIELSGEWQYMIGAKSSPMPAPAFVQWRPLGLYNGMIAPVTSYSIKGFIWYQGESNTKNPGEYENLLKALIADWRQKWNMGNLPFLYVQLPNFMEASEIPMESSWAELREAQRRTLSVPCTGMAVAIDLGEWNDIHPVNKKDVGFRLALAAMKTAYRDKTIVAYGPMYQSGKIDGNRIILSFTDTGSGLTVKNGDRPEAFAIAGADRTFVRADAEIIGDSVAVWSEKVSHPVYVKYAWADNPADANLYNLEGLPASPFTTE